MMLKKIVFVRNSLAGSRSVLLFQGTYNSGRDLEIPAGVDMVVKFSGGGAAAATVTDVYDKATCYRDNNTFSYGNNC